MFSLHYSVYHDFSVIISVRIGKISGKIEK